MSAFIDLVGQRFGKLIVISRVNADASGNATWLCKCDCGKEKVINGNSLKRGKTTSCGCKVHHHKNFVDLTGKKFGKLTVLEEVVRYRKTKPVTYWKCQCDCQSKDDVFVSDGNLISGHVKSCGCMGVGRKRKELIGQRFGKLTVIELDHIGKTNFWLCRCDCGKEKVYSQEHMILHVTSCGCDHGTSDVIDGNNINALNALYRHYKISAYRRNTSFELNKNYFKLLTKANCYYCGNKPEQIHKYKRSDYVYNGIDRINPSLGYIFGNVVPCCGKCNHAKFMMTAEEFIEWGTRFYNNFIKLNAKYAEQLKKDVKEGL